MKRLVRSRSWGHIYGQKWQNIEVTNEIQIDNGLRSASGESTEIAQVSVTQPVNTIPTSRVAAAPHPPITGQPNGRDNENQTWQGNRTGSRSDRQSMYRAALEGDWLAAEVILERDHTLAFAEITEKGDRALHVAAAIKHTKFVQKLVQRMSSSELALLDGSGFTACCYAAISGMVETVDVMMKKNPNLGTARDKNNITPLSKAALHGKAKIVSYFLKSIKVEDLSKEEWFDLLLVTVRSKMYGVALEILKKDGSLATMMNAEGTAFHLLARQDIHISSVSTKKRLELVEGLFGKDAALNDGNMQPDLRLLAEKLWAEIQRLDQASVLELIKKPSILHDAAKVGNVELITMLNRTYPDLIWDTDSKGYTIFHIAVIYRQENVFGLIHQTGANKDLIATSQDENGNNILHLVGELAPPKRRNILSESAFQMQREIAWFKEVEAIVPPFCLEMRNKDERKPRESFSNQHKSLLEKSEKWMRKTATTCMCVATMMLVLGFVVLITPPGGKNGKTVFPISLKGNWFAWFAVIEAFVLLGSTLSIMMFWSVMTSSFEEDQFLSILPYQLKMGFTGLFGSFIGAISAAMSAYYLVFLEESTWLVKCVSFSVYIVFLLEMWSRYRVLWFNTSLPAGIFGMLFRPIRHSLFSHNDTTGKV